MTIYLCQHMDDMRLADIVTKLDFSHCAGVGRYSTIRSTAEDGWEIKIYAELYKTRPASNALIFAWN